ncbi:MAG: fused MFS/spermidine synthase, partial [Planctomycetes bacterium]|nr:fused MFS/spermidine synthase [Planctomycetota bacterium]
MVGFEGAAVLRRAAAVAALAGFACMAAELTAVRVLAPHFGDSAYVWTNVIGVILAALALGAWLGGRLAGSSAGFRRAGLALVGGALGIAVAPWLAPWLGGWLLPAGLPLDTAMPTMVRGSFVATFVLFAPAMVCIGAVSPLLVTAVVQAGNEVGRAAGALGAAGTLGSLAGTFAATHWLVPTFGCRLAMAVAAALLVVASLTLPRPRRPLGVLALLVGVAATALLPRGSLAPAGAGERLLAEVESRTQFLQVLRSSDEPARIRLRINEGLDSYHSLAIEGSSFTAGAYYDWHALAPFLCEGGVGA